MANTNRGPSAELMAQLSSARRPSPELARRLGLADDLLNIEITDERIQANIAPLRDAVSYWKAYPDKFVEFLAGPNSKFKFYSYQRIMLRAGLRSTYTFMTFPRA